MSITDVTAELKAYVDDSRKRLELIVGKPVRTYLDSVLTDPEWFAALLHTTGSEPDEAIRLSRVGAETDHGDLAAAVARKLANGIVSTTLMPALLPPSLLNATNQAVLACLRDAAEGEMDEA
jgi:hypothetical protein